MLNMFYKVINFPKVWLPPATYPKDPEKAFLASSCTTAGIPFRHRLPSFPLWVFPYHTGSQSLSCRPLATLPRSNVVLSALTANLTELDFSGNFNATNFNLAPGHWKTQSSRISKDKLPCTCFSCSVSSASPHAPAHHRATVHFQEHRVSRYVWSPNCGNAKSSRSGWECTG